MRPPEPEELLAAARLYRDRHGWRAIPVVGKVPAGPWRRWQSAAPDDGELRRAFLEPRGITGLALLGGAASAMLGIRDFDAPGAFDRWASKHPEEASTAIVAATGRGHHVYGTLDREIYAQLEDGELRGDSKHFTISPPSVHATGRPYRWLTGLPRAPLPAFPPSLLARASRGPDVSAPRQRALPLPPLYDLSNIPVVSQCDTRCDTFTWVTSPAVQTAIMAALPGGPGERNRRLFHLARQLRGLRPAASEGELRAAVTRWHDLALPVIRTKDFGASWRDFQHGWRYVRILPGTSLAGAWQRALARSTGSLPPAVDHYQGALRQLVALCVELSSQWMDGCFPLGCRVVAGLMGCSTMQGARLLRHLERDGVLELRAPASWLGRRAREWRLRC